MLNELFNTSWPGTDWLRFGPFPYFTSMADHMGHQRARCLIAFMTKLTHKLFIRIMGLHVAHKSLFMDGRITTNLAIKVLLITARTDIWVFGLHMFPQGHFLGI